MSSLPVNTFANVDWEYVIGYQALQGLFERRLMLFRLRHYWRLGNTLLQPPLSTIHLPLRSLLHKIESALRSEQWRTYTTPFVIIGIFLWQISNFLILESIFITLISALVKLHNPLQATFCRRLIFQMSWILQIWQILPWCSLEVGLKCHVIRTPVFLNHSSRLCSQMLWPGSTTILRLERAVIQKATFIKSSYISSYW